MTSKSLVVLPTSVENDVTVSEVELPFLWLSCSPSQNQCLVMQLTSLHDQFTLHLVLYHLQPFSGVIKLNWSFRVALYSLSSDDVILLTPAADPTKISSFAARSRR